MNPVLETQLGHLYKLYVTQHPGLADARAVVRRQLEAHAELKADAEAELARLTELKIHLGMDLERRCFVSHAIYEMLSSILQ